MQHRTLNAGFNIRLPDGLRDQIKIEAAKNRRSMNAEIVMQLERIYADAENEKAGSPTTA